jgi:hypothetical protein
MPAQAQPQVRRLNNFTAFLLDSASLNSAETVSFTRPLEGWIFISAGPGDTGEHALILDGNERDPILLAGGEAMRHVAAGTHALSIASYRS